MTDQNEQNTETQGEEKKAAKKPASPRKAPAAKTGAAAKPRAAKPAPAKKPEVTVVKKPSRALRTEENEKPEFEAAISSAPQKEKQNIRDFSQQYLDKQGRAYATGKRKNAIARVWIFPGKGKVTVNGRDQAVYFGRPTQRMLINQPFQLVNREGQFDVMCTVVGGGLSGQAGAVRHGLSKALTYYEPSLRATLKKAGLLTRDSRIVERKKYGKHKARRSTQWVKR